MSRFLKLDSNHMEIRKHLEENNVNVFDACRLGLGVADLITYTVETGFIEVKKEKTGSFYRSQITFLANCASPSIFTYQKEYALLFALEPRKYALNERHKLLLRQLLKVDRAKKFTVRDIRSFLEWDY